jgi:tripartite-type tricarboxylate transporter receptor subunit TctC
MKATPVLALLFAATLPLAAQGQTVEEFYKKNNQIDMIINSAPGGGYDFWARLLAQYMGEYIPGKPSLVPKNMPGAGGLTAASYIYAKAPKDGTTLGMFSQNVPLQAFMDRNNQIQIDARKFSWVGTPATQSLACAAMKVSGITKADQIFDKELLLGGSGPASGPSIHPTMIAKLTGAKFKIIEGYGNNSAIALAIRRNEVQGICTNLAEIKREFGKELASGEMNLLFVMDSKRLPNHPDVPSIHEFMKTESDRQVFGLNMSSTELGRPIGSTPDVPADRLRALRAAFLEAMKNPKVLEAAEKAGQDVTVKSGEEVAAIIDRTYNTPADLIERARAIMPEGH